MQSGTERARHTMRRFFAWETKGAGPATMPSCWMILSGLVWTK
jgi:hypothetical protein